MPGDYSRKIFNRQKHYSGVLMQQGRVQLDADWNEQLDIQQYRTHTESIDVIGSSGVPKKGDGFKISVLPGGTDLLIAPGRLYVSGLLCELDPAMPPVTYKQQPWYPNPDIQHFIGSPLSSPPGSPPASPPASPPSSPPGSPPSPVISLNLQNGAYIAYLEAWQREINYHDDPLIQEVALGEADTTTRLQTVWQVKLLKVNPGNATPECDSVFPEWDTIIAPPSGRMNVRTNKAADSPNPCSLPPSAGFRRLENQLYRVEVQRNGTRANARFKWSRDNGSVETRIEKVNGSILTVADVGKDDILGFGIGQWVEIVDETATLNNTPHPLVKIHGINPATREITLESSAAAYAGITNLKLRRWDQSDAAATADGVPMTGDWLDLEDGIQVQFSEGNYKAGDYWLIPARTATGEVEWPPYAIPNTSPVSQPPAGTPHYYCRLALITVQNGSAEIDDCRELFPSLTEICAEDICYTSNTCLSQATTVQEALDLLCASRSGACTFTAMPGPGWESVFDQIPAGTDAQVCFPAGSYPVTQPVQITNKGHIKISGCGPGTRILAPAAEAAMVFNNCKSVLVRDIYAETGSAGPARLNGTLTFVNCPNVDIEYVNLKCGSGFTKNATCITTRNDPASPGQVRIQNCNLSVGYLQQGILVVNALRSLIEHNVITVYERPANVLTFPELVKAAEYRAAARSIFMYDVQLTPGETGPGFVILTFANVRIQFRTYSSLLTQAAWAALLQANPPTDQVIVTPMGLLMYVRKLVDRILLDETFRNNIGRGNAFASLFNLIVRTDETFGWAGITVGGQIAKEVKVHQNTVEGFLQGVHVGVSHRVTNNSRDLAEAVTIADNNITIVLPLYGGRWDRHGIFAGNTQSLVIENNHVQLRRLSANTNIIAIDGLRVWGQLGGRMMVTQNHLLSADNNQKNSFNIGIHINPILQRPNTAQWIVMWNVAPSVNTTVVVINGAIALEGTNAG
ncbi:DUF6519 domain-containing protein [uncultured Chitinophaga sp.]|jgi:hypothetical protein|uniref:DUF6519 domain-containing protein n=1 Tax=uncultured Chitinophaga sp. TaxID=339340 RepID=UPI00261902B8|nr:DUF6519 domain-containing protein [uncultured Chitinophaga sp.]